ncbi:hypothetical protein BC629DRAFT_1040669 [Irpex lacteus]|nr:hypothetical protein BC629DRAFT_1040669 [Irpex lacteus]
MHSIRFGFQPDKRDPTKVESAFCKHHSLLVSCTGNTIIVTQTIPDSLTSYISEAASYLSRASIIVTTSLTPTPVPPPPPGSITQSLQSSPITASSRPGTSASQSTNAPSSLTTIEGSTAFVSGQTTSGIETNPTAAPSSMITSLSSNEPSGINTITLMTSAEVASRPATSPPISATQTPESSLPQPEQALATHSSKAGPIAGGVIGGLFLLAVLLLLLLYRKKIASRLRRKHQVAPSAEFLNAGTRAVSPRDGAFVGAGRITPHQRAMSMHEGSRAGSPYVAQRLGSSLSMRGNEEGMAGMAGVGIATLGLAAVGEGTVPPDEPPPPFSRGNFNDPLVEKLNDAARQRQELYRAAVSPGFAGRQQDLEAGSFAYANSPTPLAIPSSAPYVSGDSSSSSASHGRQDSDTTRTSHQGVFNKSAYVDPFHDSDSEEDMKNTSPMLNPSKVSRLSMQVEADSRTRKQSQAGEIGWAV